MRRRTVTGIAVAAVFTALPIAARGVALAQYGPMGYMRGPAGTGGAIGTRMEGMMGRGGRGMMRGPGMNSGMPMMSRAPSDRWLIEEMTPHHGAAVTMANLALTQAEHAELKALAQQIAATQTREIADMRAWYRAWFGVDTVPPGPMDRMHDAMHAGAKKIDGARPFDEAFIEHMIPHHQVAVMMATHALASAERAELQTLLQSIITSQSAEIRQMQTWYRTWYGAG